MKASEIRSMTPEQLNEKLVGLKKDLFYLRMQHATNQLDNPLKIRETKHCPSQDHVASEGALRSF